MFRKLKKDTINYQIFIMEKLILILTISLKDGAINEIIKKTTLII